MVQPCATKELGRRRYRCFFELTLQVIGGKWKPVILYHLAQSGVLRFNELRRGIPDVTERMLTRQLRELAADGLVLRTAYPQVPPRVEYSLTGQGASLIPILLELRRWGEEYERSRTGGEAAAGPGVEAPEPPRIFLFLIHSRTISRCVLRICHAERGNPSWMPLFHGHDILHGYLVARCDGVHYARPQGNWQGRDA